MKAIILEVKDGYAAALREDGLVVKTRQLAAVGETVELSEKVVQFPSQGRRIARTAVAAALALAVTGGAYTYTNVAAASYVTLDTEETSVELSVNRMGRVVGVRALDENSSELAESLAADVRRMKVEDAVDAAMQRMDGASTVVAGVTGDTEKRTAEVQEAVERGAGRTERADMEFVTLEISKEERREAAGRWAFERGGGRWRDEDDDRDDIDDWDDDDFDDDDRPAFAPGQQNGAAPMMPPPNGNVPAGQPPRMERDDDEDDRDDQDDRDEYDEDDFDEDDRPTRQDVVELQVPPAQNMPSQKWDENQTISDENGGKVPENTDMRPQDEKQTIDQAASAAPENGQTPPEGALSFVPRGDRQPPQDGLQPPPMGGGMGAPGEMPVGAPQG